MFIGFYKLGDPLTLRCLCENNSNVPTAPDAAPIAKIYSGSTLVLTRSLPAPDPTRIVGFFFDTIMLGPGFAAGDYQITYSYTLSSVAHSKKESFTLLPSGSIDGSIIAMTAIHRPQAEYLLYETDAGKLFQGTNPSIQ